MTSGRGEIDRDFNAGRYDDQNYGASYGRGYDTRDDSDRGFSSRDVPDRDRMGGNGYPRSGARQDVNDRSPGQGFGG